MDWSEARASYPDRWLLVEALQARSSGGQRILVDLAVVGVFPDSRSALAAYTTRHHEMPGREFYVVHTNRVELEITERLWMGLRAAV